MLCNSIMGICGNIGSCLKGSELREVNDLRLDQHGYAIHDEVIGGGSFSKINRASKNGEAIAVKIMDQENHPEIFEENYVSREIDILQKIRHRNIVKIYQIFEYPPKVYIFMEMVDGSTLWQYISDNEPMKENKAREFFRQLTDAFQYLHKKGIAHRDLKPENIMIHQEVEVKVIDFGFAVHVDASDDMNLINWGRSPYTAPEVSLSTYDPLAFDIWSLGGVLFFMVTGYAPFSSSSEEALFQDQTSKTISYPRNCDLSTHLTELINGMLEPNASERLNIDQVRKSNWMQKSELMRLKDTNLEQDIAKINLL